MKFLLVSAAILGSAHAFFDFFGQGQQQQVVEESYEDKFLNSEFYS